MSQCLHNDVEITFIVKRNVDVAKCLRCDVTYGQDVSLRQKDAT